jgi:predicted amidohydrolase YtcJ
MFCSLSCSSESAVVQADLVLTNGKIALADRANNIKEAVAVVGDRIYAVGSSNEIKQYISNNTKVIDLKGKLVIPGIIDSHGHFFSMGSALLKLDLTSAKNWPEIIEMVKQEVLKRGKGVLISGRGWHQEKWDKVPEPCVEGLPVHDLLSAVSPDNPVILRHASGHSCLVNKKAMDVAGIDKYTKAPRGGEIVKDKLGYPIGVFRENAQGLFKRVYKEYKSSTDDREAVFNVALNECLKYGITGFHDASVSFKTIDFYRKLLSEGKLKIRFNLMINENNENLEKNIGRYRIKSKDTGHFLVVRTIKRFIDGALGSHGAWLLKPYLSLPSSRGLNTESIEVMKKTAEIAINNGFQLATHAIGDRANRETLNIYIEAMKQHPDKKDIRWRIEHSQHLALEDIPRFGKYGIIPSMQAVHCTSDGPWVFKRLGEQRAGEGAYVWRKLMNGGSIIPNGTDVPVEKVNTMPGFYALITRKIKNGKAFYPDQCLTREEALKAYTFNGAYTSFEENIKGSIEVGKLADMAVLSKDILTISEDDILSTEVLYTIVGGEIKYNRVGKNE